MSLPEIIFGLKPCVEALRSGQTINRFYFAKESRAAGCKGVIDEAKRRSIPFDFVPQAKVNELTRTHDHQGIAAKLSPIAYANLADVLEGLPERSTILILDQIHHPKNLGLIIRTSVGAGASAIVLTARKGALVDDSVIRSSVGTAFSIPIVKSGNVSQTMKQLKNAGFWIYGLDAQGTTNVMTLDWPPRSALIVGNESKGLRPNIAKNCDDLVCIPLHNGLDSLNAAVATGIALFQATQDRT